MTKEKEIEMRKVDAVGRISIPVRKLEDLAIKDKTPILIYISEENKIVIQKDIGLCVFCGSENLVVHEIGVPICAKCRSVKKNLSNLIDRRYERLMMKYRERLVIPFKIRYDLGINIGDKLTISKQNNFLVIDKIKVDE